MCSPSSKWKISGFERSEIITVLIEDSESSENYLTFVFLKYLNFLFLMMFQLQKFEKKRKFKYIRGKKVQHTLRRVFFESLQITRTIFAIKP